MDWHGYSVWASNPGYVFLRTSICRDPLIPLLGTPNAVGLGYFLAQHKPELGNLRVTGVVVFHGDTETKLPCLAFHVQPVPEDENKKDPDDPQGPGGNHPADWVGPVPPSLEVLGGCEGDQEHIDGSCSVSR